MNFLITLLTLSLLVLKVLPAESRSVTFYSDGALVESEASATKGMIEIPLPARTIEGSLRIKPANGTSLLRVDIV